MSFSPESFGAEFRDYIDRYKKGETDVESFKPYADHIALYNLYAEHEFLTDTLSDAHKIILYESGIKDAKESAKTYKHDIHLCKMRLESMQLILDQLVKVYEDYKTAKSDGRGKKKPAKTIKMPDGVYTTPIDCMKSIKALQKNCETTENIIKNKQQAIDLGNLFVETLKQRINHIKENSYDMLTSEQRKKEPEIDYSQVE
jgi:hypothetical protein